MQCNNCRKISLDEELLTAPSPFDATAILSACRHCRVCDEGFVLLCDEPGCNRAASCGWPTADGGYRQTCGRHMQP